MGSPSAWKARIVVRRPDGASSVHLERALRPEAAREVPRSHATLVRLDDRTILLEVEASDTGALRAAVNAFLGWVRLALAAESVARDSGRAGSRGPPM